MAEGDEYQLPGFLPCIAGCTIFGLTWGFTALVLVIALGYGSSSPYVYVWGVVLVAGVGFAAVGLVREHWTRAAVAYLAFAAVVLGISGLIPR